MGAMAVAKPVQIEQSSSYTTVAFEVIGELLFVDRACRSE
jgi:hypothetical protein